MRPGLTITELLVVILIITVLAAVVMIGVRKASAAARFATSVSNLRQIGAGVAGYAVENGGKRPYFYSKLNGSTPYLKHAWQYQGLGLTKDYLGIDENQAGAGAFFLDPADKLNERFFRIPWSQWSVVVSSYILRGGEATSIRRTELTDQLSSWDRRALVSSYFLYNSAQPENYPLTWHPGRYAVLYGNLSVKQLPIPPYINKSNPPPLAGSTAAQTRLWDWFDEN